MLSTPFRIFSGLFIFRNELIPHKDNYYFFDDIEGERWRDFLQSVKTSGVIEPVVITQDKVIVSGHQRVRACKELGIEQVPCRVMIYEAKGNWTKEDVILKDLIETNICQRGIGNINPIKLSRCIVKLEEIYGIKHGRPEKSEHNVNLKSQEELADDLGMTQQNLIRYKSLQKLTPELQELVERRTYSH